MEYNKINYAVIEEAFMNAESKDYIQQVFQVVATNILDSEIYTLKSDNLPASLKSIPKTLNISNDKALILILSLHNLMKEYIGTSMMDENVLAAKFPTTFKKQLKSFIFKMMREFAPQTKKYF